MFGINALEKMLKNTSKQNLSLFIPRNLVKLMQLERTYKKHIRIEKKKKIL